MRAVSRIMQCSAVAASIAIAAQAQNVVPVFSSVNVRTSTDGTSVAVPNIFGSSPVNLSCPATGAVTGVLSGAVTSTTAPVATNLLVDNYIAVTAGGVTTNLCGPVIGPGAGGNPASCFRAAYSTAATDGTLPSLDPDVFLPEIGGGVAPIDVSSYLTNGANLVTFDLADFGGFLSTSTINLITNCSATGISGNGKISGNPISSTNPTPGELTQPFTFSGTTNLTVELLLDLSKANTDGTLAITNGVYPTATDQAFDPALFPSYVAGTSFATAQCLIHNGELLNSEPACKLYTLTCQVGTGASASGAQCPTSSARNIVVQDVFDFPALSLPDIVYTGNGYTETFPQGFGLLEAAEGWTGGACAFDPAAEQTYSCPENLLTLFEGPGVGKGTGTPSPHLNSEFISVGPVPEYRSHVDLSPWKNHEWVNSHDVTATFNTRSPKLPPNFNGGVLNGFVAAPLSGITYGISPVAGSPTPGNPIPGLPSPEFPVPGDKTISYPNGCDLPAPDIYTPAPVQLHVNEDGKYLIHFFATDCAGTEELYFRQDATGSWYTNFFTAQMFVDTVSPQVTGADLFPDATVIGNTLAYHQNAPVHAAYQCSDDFSGVATCGAKIYASPFPDPGVVVSRIDTSKLGTFSYTVPVADAAGNTGTSVTLKYTVVP